MLAAGDEYHCQFLDSNHAMPGPTLPRDNMHYGGLKNNVACCIVYVFVRINCILARNTFGNLDTQEIIYTAICTANDCLSCNIIEQPLN